MDISSTELSLFLDTCHQAARAGGQILKNWLGKINVCEKNPGDLVTEADYESQKTIRKILLNQFPQHSFLGEEEDGLPHSLDPEGFSWIVDPLDGTTNFVHQLPSFSVSIALAYRGEIIVGTVFDPLLDECYSAALHLGATLNDELIETSRCVEISKSLSVCSFSSHVKPGDPQVERFLNVMYHAGSVRRLGSAALNLCYVACGRLDAYWASSLKVWDVAAGVLILREAGGIISHIEGGDFDLIDPRFLAAANSAFHQQMEPLITIAPK